MRFHIRPAVPEDASAIWKIIEPTIRAGETFPLPRDMTERDAIAFWMGADRETFVVAEQGRLIGSYYLRPNYLAAGAHVANCGYMTAPDASGRGVGRAMCEHSLAAARARGYRAMQFNLVVSTNERAVHLWQSCGFKIVGVLPGAFAHPARGDVDALVMLQQLS